MTKRRSLIKIATPSKETSNATFPAYGKIQHGETLALPLSNRTTELTHGLHRFPAKFVPQIPEWAIREFSKPGQLVLDPFAGSGTTLVEALVAGRRAVGIDIDILNTMICRSKTYLYSAVNLNLLAKRVLTYSSATSIAGAKIQGVQNFHHWFNSRTAKSLKGLYSKIEKLNCSVDERLFFLTIFSSILRRVSNADDQTQKTYVSGTSKKAPPLVDVTFKKHLERALKGVQQLLSRRKRYEPVIALVGSAADLPIKSNSVDLVVTSPPYIDSVDYMYNFMLEYFWLGPRIGVTSRAEFNAKRRIGMGSKNPSNNFLLPAELKDLISLNSVPAYRRNAVTAYFALMKKHFEEAQRVLKTKGGTYVLIVGNSSFDGDVLPVHDCLIRLAAISGLGVDKAFNYRIRRHYMKFPRKGRGGIILFDWVIVLRKRKAVSHFTKRLKLMKLEWHPEAVAN